MAEVLYPTPDSLIGTTTKIVSKLQRAREKLEEYPSLYESYKQELSSIESVVGVVTDQPCLQHIQTKNVLQRLRQLSRELEIWLDRNKIGDKNTAQQFAHHLTKGSREERALSGTMNKLSRAKSDLILLISVAAIGVSQMTNNVALANLEIIQRIDALLVRASGDGQGLRIAQLVKGKAKSRDGSVRLSKRELDSLSSEDGLSSDEPERSLSTRVASVNLKERIVSGNVAEDRAVQLNTFIEYDPSGHINRMEIINNKAKDDSLQCNYPMSMDVFDRIMQRRNEGLEMMVRASGKK